MNPFPAVDPIPLPAPIWLFKLLHIVTLSLHFVAVEMLLGGLLLAVGLSLFNQSAAATTTARALARRLTVVMTYVINLGVPPLLFAQVLYGRAIYTSSVLIGVWWIAVIPLLMLCYWLLYRFSGLGTGTSGLVAGRGSLVGRRVDRQDLLDEYDAHAAAGGLAANVCRIAHGHAPPTGRSDADVAMALHAQRRAGLRRPVDGVAGGS